MLSEETVLRGYVTFNVIAKKNVNGRRPYSGLLAAIKQTLNQN